MKCPKFTQNGRDVTDECDIANYFNQYFANIGPNLSKNIPKGSSTYEAFLNHPCDNSFFLQPVTENEILAIIKALKMEVQGLVTFVQYP